MSFETGPTDGGFVRRCPQCGSERPVGELYCENRPRGEPFGVPCHWPLSEEEIVAAGSAPPSPAPAAAPSAPALRHCANGHPLGAGDEICFVCGADPAEGPAAAASEGTGGTAAPAATPDDSGDATATATATAAVVDGWLLLRRVYASEAADRYVARPESPSDDAEVELTLYRAGAEPDRAVQAVLRRMPADHVPRLIAAGHFGEHAYEVSELISGGTLEEVRHEAAADKELLRRIVDELGRALESFAELSLRHRDLHPGNIVLRTREPLDLVVKGFGSARLSDFDLEAVAPLELTRYSAPEAIVGAVSAASDWWSLGMIVLELATGGACWGGVNDQAFRLHVVTRGIPLPAGLDPDVSLLLRGLLARDPLRRWAAREVRAWLAGEAVDAPPAIGEGLEAASAGEGRSLELGGRAYRRPEFFALAGAEAANWEAARELTLRGAVATWLGERGAPEVAAQARRVAAAESLPDDFRHALTLMAMNPALPLTVRGEIVTPGWLLENPREGYELIAGEVTRHLERMKREPWLVQLRLRAEQVRERARLLGIALDEERLRIALLATSRANLEAERDGLRRIYPDTAHPGLASILERRQVQAEDLILLIAARAEQFLPLEGLLAATRELAAATGVAFDEAAAAELLVRPRREIFAAVDERTAHFARCGHFEIDAWADAFRVERRMPLPRAAILLGMPAESFREPPKQQYVATLLEHFEKRVAGAVSRGPLARFAIGKLTPRVDLGELGTGLKPAEAILAHVLSRAEVPVLLDPEAYFEGTAEARLRRLASQAISFRRDTGLDGRILGFPFLWVREARGRGSEPLARPRLMPLLLWPVVFEMPPGAASPATLMFDREREEVRLNPALESVLAPAALQQWRAAREEVLGRSSLKPGDVIDIFGALAPPRGRQLARLPAPGAKAEPGAFELLPSAALFNAEFTGQSVAEDLRKMRQCSPAGTGLDALLRAGAGPPAPAASAPARTPEQDRYLVVESDPSQEAAVEQSRLSPGLLVEGPPGTGKSQTIVNVIADAVGRGQTVLVVCQKQAALQVVKKRLEAEGLGDRLFLVVDINKDRELVIKSLRQQLENARYAAPGEALALRRQREEKAARIEVIEAEIDRHHQALHDYDELAGGTYRELLGELLGLEAAKGYLDVPALRPLFKDLGRGRITRLEEICAPLGRLWLASRFEGSSLAALSSFPADAGVAAALGGALAAFGAAEEERLAVYAASPAFFETDDPAPLLAWLRDQGSRLERLSFPLWSSLAAWQALFRADAGGGSAGLAALASLEGALAALERLAAAPHDEALYRAASALSPLRLQEELADAVVAAAPASFLGRLNPLRWLVRRRVAARLAALGEPSDDARMEQLRVALELETRLRPIRQAVAATFELLGLAAPAVSAAGAPSLPALRREAGLRVVELRTVSAAAAAVDACPRPQEAAAMVAAARPEAFADLRQLFEAAAARHAARERCRAALAPLAAYFSDDWLAARRGEIDRGRTARAAVESIVAALPTLIPYQQFRGRAARLEPEALTVLAQLRSRDAVLLEVPPVHLEEALRRSIRREALLAAKDRIESRHDELRFERGEIERRVLALAELDRDLRRLNRELLGQDPAASQLGTATAWEDLTRLRGPRRKSLRELMAQGRALGLLRLRPIWLMNPDVASRVLPLDAGFFDLVVYDEASQMPVEHAVPTLFRARRILVSGDEKQMPPTRFFASAIEEDEEELADGDLFDEAASDIERSALEERWNRREVKDCPDLLQLGRGALPQTTLQIHYRSQYRELISFSNAAFYSGGLSVPVRHPDAEVRRVRPVEVVRVDGIYEEQTNLAEAAKVVELVAAFWATPGATGSEPPSLGVVTFNRKQADLIETLIEQRAAADPLFLLAYQRERERAQDGEDMSFFVKNVENVQGDERDMILFSTTFGRDRRGAFRRNFGVLGQSGGERRLNVAVTRARQKVVLVTSIPVRDVSDWLSGERPPSQPRDFLQAYLDYAERLDVGNLAAAAASAKRLGLSDAARRRKGRAPDGFQQAVGEFLKSRGWHWVRADEAGDAFGIDFAIEDPGTGLFAIGIECDAPRQALLERARAREIWRPQVLRRAIPVVHRVLSRSWYHRPHEERERLAAAVEAALRQAVGQEGEPA